MPRQPSAIMSASDKKAQIKDLKTEIKVTRGQIQAFEKQIKTLNKDLGKLEGKLAVLSPKKPAPQPSRGVLRGAMRTEIKERRGTGVTLEGNEEARA